MLLQAEFHERFVGKATLMATYLQNNLPNKVVAKTANNKHKTCELLIMIYITQICFILKLTHM